MTEQQWFDSKLFWNAFFVCLTRDMEITSSSRNMLYVWTVLTQNILISIGFKSIFLQSIVKIIFNIIKMLMYTNYIKIIYIQ